jgi:hypothetical protein
VRMLTLRHTIREGLGSPDGRDKVDLDDGILEALNEFPFSTVQSLASTLKCPKSTLHEQVIDARCAFQ